MIYPLFTFIEYIFGSRIAATKLLSNLTPKRMIGYHLFNILVSSIFSLLLSIFLLDIVKLDETYELFSQYVSFSITSIFLAYIPMLLLSYVFLVFFLMFLALIYQVVAKAFNSAVTLKTTVYSLQFLSIFHPLAHVAIYLMLLSTTVGLIEPTIILLYIIALILFFTISKQYAQISGLTTITTVLINLLIFGLIILLTMTLLGSVPT